MANQTVTVGNVDIALAGNNDPFNNEYTTGYLEFYDVRHRPLFPLTSYVIRDHLMMIINESSCSDLWKAGPVTGWIEALMENCLQTFRSFVTEERMAFFIRGVEEENCKELRARYFPESLCCTRVVCIMHIK